MHFIRSFRRVSVIPLTWLLYLALLAPVSGCANRYTLVGHAPAEPAGLAWLRPAVADDQADLLRWAGAVGPPVIVERADPLAGTDVIRLVSWNIALGAGDLETLVSDVRSMSPHVPLVVLLQEAYRDGPEVPTLLGPKALFAGRLDGRRANGERDDIETLARRSGLNVYYVPSMRNGAPWTSNEDRGNAILSTLPLDDLTAIELPFERQRRVAIAATASGLSANGARWRLRLVSAHLDNMAGPRRLWFAGSMFARARQAKALVEWLRHDEIAVLGGDFNTWLGFGDLAFTQTQRAFPDTTVTDRRPTFRNVLRLDHLFFRLPDGWSATFERASRPYGSDHWPLIATIRVG